MWAFVEVSLLTTPAFLDAVGQPPCSVTEKVDVLRGFCSPQIQMTVILRLN